MNPGCSGRVWHLSGASASVGEDMHLLLMSLLLQLIGPTGEPDEFPSTGQDQDPMGTSRCCNVIGPSL